LIEEKKFQTYVKKVINLWNVIQGYYKRNRYFQRYVVSKLLA